MALEKFLGVSELRLKGETVAASTLEGRPLLLYFSAHWCPPCRQFTPTLVKFYNAMRSRGAEFELVFVSSDRSSGDFEEYFKGMPWHAVPFAKRKEKEKLQRNVKTAGIPTLALLDKDGTLVTNNARERMVNDPDGKDFPWVPKAVSEIMKDAALMTHDDRRLQWADLAQKEFVTFYFSATWCAPCRVFTPRLATVYEKMRARGVDTEFLFVSCDRSEEAFAEYWGLMPWAALPLADDRCDELRERFSITTVPTLVTVRTKDGSVVNGDARHAAEDDPAGEKYPWEPVLPNKAQPLEPSDDVFEALNNEMCVVFDPHGAPNAPTMRAEFASAMERFVEAKGFKEKVFFFTVESAVHEELFRKVLRAVEANRGKHGEAAVMFLNVPNDRAYEFVMGEALTATTIVTRATEFVTKQLA